MPKLYLLLACSMAAITACGDDPTEGPEAFAAELTATSTALPGGRCPALTVAVSGPGTATPGGALTTIQSHCVDPAGANPGAFTDGVFVFSLSDGQISGTYEGQLIPTADPAVFTIDGVFAITDGSGDFEGATGGGDAAGETNLETGAASLELTGTIDR